MPSSARALPGARAARRLGLLVAGLMALAAAAGLALPGLYRDNDLVTAAWKGNDLVTLLVAVPLLLLAVRSASRGSVRGQLVLAGMHLYALYGYAFYLFGAAFNALFLVYVAITAASAWALALALQAVDVEAVAASVTPGRGTRAVAAYTATIGVLLGLFWTALSVGFLLTGEPPAMVEATSHPTNVTGALDLSIVVTLALVSGAWLWRGRPWGYALALAWNVKGAVYMLALSGASVAAWWIGPAEDLVQVALWGPIGLGCAVSAGVLLRAYRQASTSRV